MANLFKRADFWVLLLLVGGAGGYLAFSGRPAVPGGDATRFSVEEMTLKRDYGNFLATFRVAYDNREGEAFDPVAEAKLLADGERAIPGYFLATDSRVLVAAGKQTELTLKYWMEASDLAGTLTLEIRDERLQVKSATPFEGEAVIENQGTRSFAGPDWK